MRNPHPLNSEHLAHPQVSTDADPKQLRRLRPTRFNGKTSLMRMNFLSSRPRQNEEAVSKKQSIIDLHLLFRTPKMNLEDARASHFLQAYSTWNYRAVTEPIQAIHSPNGTPKR